MAFEETEVGVTKLRADATASISGSSPERLRLTLAFSSECASRIGLKELDRAKVLVGTGEHAGLVRLMRGDGNCQISRIGRGAGSLVLSCGRHSSFTTPRRQAPCMIVQQGAKTIEIKLPAPWPEKPFGKSTGSRVRKPVAEESPAQPMRVCENGVAISFVKGEEQVAVGKKRVDVSPRCALAMRLLAKSLGKPVGRAWLMNELWPGKSAQECHGEFDRVMRDLGEAAKAVGLRLVFAGTGYTLMQRKAAA